FVSGHVPEKISEIEYMGKTVLISSSEEMIIDRLNAAKWRNIQKDLEWARVMISTGGRNGTEYGISAQKSR
ncbi:MAG: hypothetical protein PHG70_06190, partial [Synergistaceae bacterium]|nr:hypothetical protein [Synergistaceae bacterium]